MKLKVSIIVLMISLLSYEGMSQLNFTVAFNGGYTIASNNNQMLKDFNRINADSITDAFKPLKFMTGLDLGFRYNVDYSAFTIGYSTMRRKRDANQLTNASTVLNTTMNYSMGTVYLGFETGTNKVRLGSTIGYRNTKIKATIGSSSDFETIVQERNWVSKFYLNFIARGNDISSIALRPYFDFSWGGTNLDPAYDRLLSISPGVSDNFHMFGLSIVFFNGPQNNF